MGPVVVVVVEPVAEGLVSGLVVGPGLGVGPFGFEGLVVSFHFAVLLGMIRFDRDMTDAVLGEQGSERSAAGVAAVVIGHDLRDVGDAQLVEVVYGAGGERPGQVQLGCDGVPVPVQAGHGGLSALVLIWSAARTCLRTIQACLVACSAIRNGPCSPWSGSGSGVRTAFL